MCAIRIVAVSEAIIYIWLNQINVSCNDVYGAIHLVRTARRGVGGSSALRTPMYCFHSDVIICAYRGGGGGV